jgi:hypothetical protein
MKKSFFLLLFVFVLNPFFVKSQSIPTEGLELWYPFNNNANDESGNGLDGIVQGATLVEDRFGNSTSAYSFDGTDDYIQASLQGTESFLGLTQGTLSFWFKRDVNDQASASIFSISNTATSDGVRARVPHTNAPWNETYTAFFSVTEDGTPGGGYTHLLQLTTPDEENSVMLSDNEWHHFVVVVDGENNRIYLDGIEQTSYYVVGGENTNAFTNIINPDLLTVGVEHNERFFHGCIDDLAMYSIPLTDLDIQELYNSSMSACVPDYLPIEDLEAYYPFCGNANDESGNGLDGIVEGATLVEDRFGNSASAYYFDGIDDIITADVDINSSIIGHQEGTVILWFKSAGGANERAAVLAIGDNTGQNDETNIRVPHENSGNTMASFFSVTNDDEEMNYQHLLQLHTEFNQNQEVFDGEWHSLAVVTGDGNNRIYIDGTAVAVAFTIGDTMVNAFTNLLTPDKIVMGAENDWENAPNYLNHFNGFIDDIVIYSRALSEIEIQQLFDFEELTEICLPESTPIDGLIAYYPFCGNADDFSGNGLDGSVSGPTLVDDRFGNSESAYDFDGGSNIITLPSPFESGVNEVSISVWFKPEFSEVSTGHKSLWQQGEGFNLEDGISYFTYYSEPPRLQLGFGTSNANFNAIIIDNPSQEWHLAVMTYNGTEISLYIDSEFVGSSALSAAEYVSDLPLAIGNLESQTLQGFIGQIDDVGIWDRALNPNEVNLLFWEDYCDPCLDNYALGDLNCDGNVSVADLSIFLVQFGQSID